MEICPTCQRTLEELRQQVWLELMAELAPEIDRLTSVSDHFISHPPKKPPVDKPE